MHVSELTPTLLEFKKVQLFGRPDGSLDQAIWKMVEELASSEFGHILIIDPAKRVRHSLDVMRTIALYSERFSIIETESIRELATTVLTLDHNVDFIIINHLTYPFRIGMLENDPSSYRELAFILALLYERPDTHVVIINEARKDSGTIVPVTGNLIAKYVDASFSVEQRRGSIQLQER